jgi:hypothetical protein
MIGCILVVGKKLEPKDKEKADRNDDGVQGNTPNQSQHQQPSSFTPTNSVRYSLMIEH